MLYLTRVLLLRRIQNPLPLPLRHIVPLRSALGIRWIFRINARDPTTPPQRKRVLDEAGHDERDTGTAFDGEH